VNQLKDIIQATAATPRLTVGDVTFNVDQTIETARSLTDSSLIVFPELGLTGYTLADLVHQPTLLTAARLGLLELAEQSADIPAILIVGLPLDVQSRLFNVAAIVYVGQILGIVPKVYLPNYQEFYEARWYVSGENLTASEVTIGNQTVPIGTDLLFDCPAVPGLTLGVEICEDLWVPLPPSTFMALSGATVIANLSASNELAGKAGYRRDLVVQQSARLRAGYVYASAGVDESTTDLVFGGHNLIAANGQLLAESQRLVRASTAISADIDLAHLAFDRRRAGTFRLPAGLPAPNYRRIPVPLEAKADSHLIKPPSAAPFVPSNGPELDERTQEIFNLQAAALASRLQQSGIREVVLGLSGGLDSTLALLVAVRALSELGEPLTRLHAFTLPGMATSGRTKSNAHRLGQALEIQVEEIAISEGSLGQLRDIGHDATTQDVTYQNAQARYRTTLLLNKANQLGAMVLGTGDLSEIALGWATFNGDHISHYHVNAGVPKTLVRHLVTWAARQREFTTARATLLDIVDTPISPELTSGGKDALDQSTEALIGPYELTDFYLYHFIRWGDNPAKILALAGESFAGIYTGDELKLWLTSFIKRFFGAQWKRSVMPDGPKIGSVSLSPRGDWRMPSSMTAETWLRELQ